MEVKKSEKANLEHKKGLFMEIGLVVTLSIILCVFEWKSYDKVTVEVVTRAAVEVEEEVIIQTDQSLPPPPPPPPEVVSEDFEVVEDDVEIENEIKIDAEVSQEVAIEAPIYVPVVEEAVVEEEEIFQIVEEMPTFPGGEKELQKFLRKNLKYPIVAQEAGIQGKVYVNFVVEKDGKISNVKVARGIGGGCDEEAIRVVKMLPNWKAGKQRGVAVRAAFTLPIIFNLG